MMKPALNPRAWLQLNGAKAATLSGCRRNTW